MVHNVQPATRHGPRFFDCADSGSFVHVTGKDLSGVYIPRATLQCAQMWKTNFRRANLRGADLKVWLCSRSGNGPIFHFGQICVLAPGVLWCFTSASGARVMTV